MGITLKQVSYDYQKGTPFEGRALSEVDITIKENSFTAFIGHTGSGKSTIMQLLSGLLVPTEGQVDIDGTTISSTSKNKSIRHIRQKVGLVFQFPESQLFEESVLKDVAFGPQNFGISKEEAEKIAAEKLDLVGIEESLFEKNPFDLSGGQMRRVAIAGILAMNPTYLVLDEPTVGLDPKGRRELMQLFKKLHQSGLTIVLVTHLMDDVAEYANYVYALDHGKVKLEGIPKDVFQKVDELEAIQLGVPKITKFTQKLVEKGLDIHSLPITTDEFVEDIING